jgi:uroporphyrinogen III methyltransferase/synthase
MPAGGRVYLVGAGPGDPELLTLRGAACLRRADVVLYDYLVNPAMLRHAPPHAERVSLGRHGSGRCLSPDQITERMIAEAKSGRTVVRLKGGDPGVFGRLDDEVGGLRLAGIPFEIVPGITAGLAVAAYCELPLTQHEEASAVALIAGRERGCKAEPGLDFAALAAFPGTLVFYMGVASAPEWSAALLRHGKPADTPVAVIGWCTRAAQRMVRCTLATITETLAQEQVQPPALCVVGKVVNHAPDESWFSMRPLFGMRVLIAGSHRHIHRWWRPLADLGAEVLPAQFPGQVADPEVQAALAADQLNWIVLHGAATARAFVHHYGNAVGQASIAALSPATAAVLRASGFDPITVEDSSPAALTRTLLEYGREALLARV